MARGLADRSATVTMIVNSCKALLIRLADNENFPEVPAFMHTNGEPPKPMSWDALRQAGHVPDWVVFTGAVRKTCTHCSLREQASIRICRACPLVTFIDNLVKRNG